MIVKDLHKETVTIFLSEKRKLEMSYIEWEEVELHIKNPPPIIDIIQA